MKFHGTLLLGGKTATGIEVPAEIVTGLGSGKRPKVRVTINNYTYRSSVAPMDGKFMIPVSEDVRNKAGVAAGDEVDVDIELDTEPRELIIPSDFAEALGLNSEAKQFFDGLSYSNKQRFTLSIEQAKTAETRQRRIEKAISNLREGKI